jgi:hypothetical protein
MHAEAMPAPPHARRVRQLLGCLHPAPRAPILEIPTAAVPAAAQPAPGDQLLRVATFELDVTPPLGAPLMHGGVAPAAEIATRLTARADEGLHLMCTDNPQDPLIAP